MNYDLMTKPISEVPVVFRNNRMKIEDIEGGRYNVCILKKGKEIYSERGISKQVICSAGGKGNFKPCISGGDGRRDSAGGIKMNCEFILECHDIEKLRSSKWTDEELCEQYDELCTTGGFGCSINEEYSSQKLDRQRNLILANYTLTGGVFLV